MIDGSLKQAMKSCNTPSVAINGTSGSTAFVAFDNASGRGIVMLTNNHSGNSQAKYLSAWVKTGLSKIS